jgi:uncharacterized protein YyaL (SSP411 family)
MERESFESEKIAKVMNEHFVNVKVDREERPDVDRVYMQFVQATTGSGGWPMNVFLTPDLKPFFGGTYFPPSDNMYSRTPGFPSLLLKISEMWKKNRDQLVESGDRIMEALNGDSSTTDTSDNKWMQSDNVNECFSDGVDSFLSIFDARYGGFGRAPKFPRPSILNFLFRMYYRHKTDKKLSERRHDEILHACSFTLTKMAHGGMYDHIGCGFSRYSVDTEWHVPHFEKMTYDQGQLLVSYAEAYQITKDEYFATIAREIIEYMSRDMTLSENGGEAFYSAEDADSYPTHDATEKKEGAFYAWTYNELKQHLTSAAMLERFAYFYDCKPGGNVKSNSDPHGELRGQNVLIQRHELSEAASRFSVSEEEFKQTINEAKKILFNERAKRPRPHLDDKIITSWNGLMISGLAKASQVLNEPKYADKAEKAATFIRNTLYNEDKKILYRSYRSGATAELIEGFLNDYCFFIAGLIDLYEATGRLQWLQWAQDLQQIQDSLFLDTEKGAYYEVTGRDPSILLRMKEDYDGAEPSGNSVSACNLTRLAQYSSMEVSQKYMKEVDRLFSHTQDMLSQAPQAVPQLLVGLDERLSPGKHIAVVYNDSIKDQLPEVLKTIHKQHLPSKTLFFVNRDDEQVMKYVQENSPYLSDAIIKNNKPTVYVCQQFACQAPVTDLVQLEKLLFEH